METSTIIMMLVQWITHCIHTSMFFKKIIPPSRYFPGTCVMNNVLQNKMKNIYLHFYLEIWQGDQLVQVHGFIYKKIKKYI